MKNIVLQCMGNMPLKNLSQVLRHSYSRMNTQVSVHQIKINSTICNLTTTKYTSLITVTVFKSTNDYYVI